ncbi:hypothetical protein KC340_g46 [Hortaea werneckii]|nr:hypothetical protein KC340_g46 [Hortaea werneckii]
MPNPHGGFIAAKSGIIKVYQIALQEICCRTVIIWIRWVRPVSVRIAALQDPNGHAFYNSFVMTPKPNSYRCLKWSLKWTSDGFGVPVAICDFMLSTCSVILNLSCKFNVDLLFLKPRAGLRSNLEDNSKPKVTTRPGLDYPSSATMLLTPTSD